MGHVNLDVDVQPRRTEKEALYLPLAPKSAGETPQLKIGIRLIITNPSTTETVKVSAIRFSYPGTNILPKDFPDVPAAMVPDTGEIPPLGKAYWCNGNFNDHHNEVFLDAPAPPQIAIHIFCNNGADKYTKTMDLVPEEDPTGKGTVFIPFSVDDLASNEYVVARGLHAGAGGARGKQIFGHDFAIETLLPNGEWTRLVAGVTEATENAHHRVFGRTVLAIADGEIDEAVDHHPDNPLGAKNKNPNFMWIRHGKMQVYYSHLKQNSIKVRSGRVVAGQRLAEVGNSGNTNGIPHLHMHGQDADSITLRGFAFKRAKILERAQVISSGPDAWVWLNTRGIPRERCAVRPSEHRTIPDLGREFELAKLWVAEVFGGVAQGGDGFVLVGGKIVKVPPRGPKWALLQSLIALEAAEKIDHPSAQKIIEEIAETIANLANELKKQR